MSAEPMNGLVEGGAPVEIDAKAASLAQLLCAEARYDAEIKARRRMRAALEAELLAPLVPGHEPHTAILAAWQARQVAGKGRRRRRRLLEEVDEASG